MSSVGFLNDQVSVSILLLSISSLWCTFCHTFISNKDVLYYDLSHILRAVSSSALPVFTPCVSHTVSVSGIALVCFLNHVRYTQTCQKNAYRSIICKTCKAGIRPAQQFPTCHPIDPAAVPYMRSHRSGEHLPSVDLPRVCSLDLTHLLVLIKFCPPRPLLHSSELGW